MLIGRALAVEPRILILDEPTRGVDIGAKQEIYALIERLVAEGMAVLLISSEMEEILRLSDRIVVLRRGRVAATLSRQDGKREQHHESRRPCRLTSCPSRPQSARAW